MEQKRAINESQAKITELSLLPPDVTQSHATRLKSYALVLSFL